MAATAAKAAFGTTIAKGAVAIAERTTVTGPNMTRETIDVTSHDSDNGFREYVTAIADAGEISLDGNWVVSDAGQAALLADFNDGSTDEYTITYPNTEASTWVFNGIVTTFNPTANYDGAMTLSATIKITGKPTFTV